MCERRVCNHSDNTNIDKCDKNILKDAITVYRDLCVSVAKVSGGQGGGFKKNSPMITKKLYKHTHIVQIIAPPHSPKTFSCFHEGWGAII